MSRFATHAPDDAPAANREPLHQLGEKFGKVLNIHASMAHTPALLHTYTAMNHALEEHGTFDARTREAIALAVGAVDNCAYCQSAHTLGAKQAGWSDDEAARIRAGEPTGSQLDALLAVVRQIAGNVGYVDDTTFEAARQAGWSEEQLAEVFAHVAVNMFTNYFNHYNETDIDLPLAPGLTG